MKTPWNDKTVCIKNAPWNNYFVCSCDACHKERMERTRAEDPEGVEFLTDPAGYRARLQANIQNYWLTFTPKQQSRAEGFFIQPEPLTKEELEEMAAVGC